MLPRHARCQAALGPAVRTWPARACGRWAGSAWDEELAGGSWPPLGSSWLVGSVRFERTAPCPRSRCADQAALRPGVCVGVSNRRAARWPTGRGSRRPGTGADGRRRCGIPPQWCWQPLGCQVVGSGPPQVPAWGAYHGGVTSDTPSGSGTSSRVAFATCSPWGSRRERRWRCNAPAEPITAHRRRSKVLRPWIVLCDALAGVGDGSPLPSWRSCAVSAPVAGGAVLTCGASPWGPGSAGCQATPRADRGARTPTPLRTLVPETSASADSARSARSLAGTRTHPPGGLVGLLVSAGMAPGGSCLLALCSSQGAGRPYGPVPGRIPGGTCAGPGRLADQGVACCVPEEGFEPPGRTAFEAAAYTAVLLLGLGCQEGTRTPTHRLNGAPLCRLSYLASGSSDAGLGQNVGWCGLRQGRAAGVSWRGVAVPGPMSPAAHWHATDRWGGRRNRTALTLLARASPDLLPLERLFAG
jgi:hypothetical protein